MPCSAVGVTHPVVFVVIAVVSVTAAAVNVTHPLAVIAVVMEAEHLASHSHALAALVALPRFAAAVVAAANPALLLASLLAAASLLTNVGCPNAVHHRARCVGALPARTHAHNRDKI